MGKSWLWRRKVGRCWCFIFLSVQPYAIVGVPAMTSLSGTRVLNEGKDRLFEPLSKLLLITDGLGIAIRVIKSGSSTHLAAKDDGASATCTSFPITVFFPAIFPTAAIANGKP